MSDNSDKEQAPLIQQLRKTYEEALINQKEDDLKAAENHWNDVVKPNLLLAASKLEKEYYSSMYSHQQLRPTYINKIRQLAKSCGIESSGLVKHARHQSIKFYWE